MSDITARIADDLAQEALALARELGDEDLVAEVSKVIGAGSSTTQEAFLTAVRIRTAEARARAYLAERRAQASGKT